MSFRFKRREPLTRGFVRIAQAEIDGALADLATASDEGVHEARRRIKKLRSLLRLMRPALGEPAFRHDREALRDAAHGLSPVRDAAVQLATLESLLEACAADEARKTEPLRRQLAPPRETAAAEAVRRTVVVARLHALRSGVEAAAQAEVDAAAQAEVDAALPGHALRRAYRGARRACAHAQDTPSDEAFHAWRKRVKTLQHQLELVRKAAPARCARLLRQLDRLAGVLGKDHDLAILNATLAGAPPEEVPPIFAVHRELATRRRRLQRKAVRLGRELFAEKPAAWLKPLVRAWARWHEPR